MTVLPVNIGCDDGRKLPLVPRAYDGVEKVGIVFRVTLTAVEANFVDDQQIGALIVFQSIDEIVDDRSHVKRTQHVGGRGVAHPQVHRAREVPDANRDVALAGTAHSADQYISTGSDKFTG